MAAYQFTPLPADGDSIRLLRVHPASSYSAPVACTIETASLRSAPPYVALSYSWGEPVFSHAISADAGLSLSVTASLHAALRSFRQHSAGRAADEGGGGLLWADQICIDQADDAERSRQVRMMRRIYETARAVLVSFGEGVEDGGSPKLVNELMADLTEKCAASTDAERWSPNVRLDPEKVIIKSQWQHWKVFMRDLMLHRYCQRVWVVQEIVFGRKVFLSYGGEGTEPFPWPTFVAAVELAPWVWVQIEKSMRAEGHTIPEEMHYEYLAPGATGANVSIISQLSLTGRKMRFLPLIIRLRSLQSSDARDRIFGLQGLASDAAEYLGADYSKTADQVYTDFGRSTILSQKDGVLLGEILAESGLHKQSRDIPSWVPDWTDEGGGALNFHMQYSIERDTFQLYGSMLDYKTSYPVEIRDVAGACSLVVRGQVLDKIEKLSPKAPPCFFGEHDIKEIREWNSASLDILRETFGTTAEEGNGIRESEKIDLGSDLGPEVLQRYARLLAANILKSPPKSSQTLENVPFDDSEVLEGYRLALTDHWYVNDPDPERTELRKFYQTAFDWTKRAERRLAVTAGKKLAIVPDRTEERDCIGWIDGYRCAVVLRRYEQGEVKGWKLVGDGFVEGALGLNVPEHREEELESIAIV